MLSKVIIPGALHAPARLRAEIIARSLADTWEAARQEWVLSDVFISDGSGRCLCGHPITEHCVLTNQLTGDQVVVGNVCVQQFMGLDSEVIFRGLRRITENRQAALSPEAITYAFDMGWIDTWARKFYLNTCRKRRLTPKQQAKRVEINAKVLSRCLRREAGNAY
jgi:hypothetical protein